jgi:hypothetical protein
LEDGLLVVEPGVRPALRFRHDRIREDVLLALSPQRRRDLHLAMARRLATAPALAAVAAEQYLPEVEAIGGTAERRVVVELMRRAADEARLTGDYARVHVLLSGALALVEPGDDATLLELHVGRHAALYSLGRLDEADAEFRTIAGLRPSVLGRVDATAVQVISLTHRKCFGEALDLGIGLLGELGITATPAERLPAALDREFADLNR